jgi:hypothetical protein
MNTSCWIHQYKEYFEVGSYIFTILGFIAIISSIIALFISRNQMRFTVIARCVDIFRDHYADISPESNQEKCLKYMDFINEELFYFQHRYIPKSVALEWIDGMLNHFPVYHNGVIVNSNYCLPQFLTLKHNYPRVKESFEIEGSYNFKLIFSEDSLKSVHYNKERRRLAQEILKNSKSVKY